MTLIAPDIEKLAEIESDTRRAWTSYRERLRGLDGEDYERVEDESWAKLQRELRRLERRRRTLGQASE